MPSKLLGPMRLGTAEPLAELLTLDVEFRSPVRNYRGRGDVAHILLLIGGVLDDLDARRELAAPDMSVTVITGSHNGQDLEGVLQESYDDRGDVTTATLLLRPLAVLPGAIAAMGRALEASPLPSSVADATSA
jgi:hypothetical protein